jgi:hypothetical protein
VRLSAFPSTCASAALAQSAAHRGIWLEIPELTTGDATLEDNGTAVLPKDGVQFVRLHINSAPGQVTYGSITTKVNTEVANVASTQKASEEGVVSEIDLKRNASIALHPGLNSVEVAFKDRWNRTHYASFLLQIPEPPQKTKVKFDPPVPVEGKKYALVIGISRYKSVGVGLTNLRYAASDAATFRDFLVSPRGGSFPAANITFLQDENATLANIKEALSNLLSRARTEDTIVIFVDAQGATERSSALDRSGNNFLLAWDTDPEDMSSTALSITEIEGMLSDDLKAKHVVVFADTSHTSSIGEKALNLVNDYWVRMANRMGLAVLTANDKGQLSKEGDEWGGHGIFTHYLLKGMEGEADADGDGTVTVAELFSYVRKKVNLDTGYEQDPLAAPDSLFASHKVANPDEPQPVGAVPMSGIMAAPNAGSKPPAQAGGSQK